MSKHSVVLSNFSDTMPATIIINKRFIIYS